MRRRTKAMLALGLAAATVVAGALPANAAETKSYSYNCTAADGLVLDSYAAQTVGHYHNGALVASWYNAGGMNRRTWHPVGPATASVYSSYNIWSSSASCYWNA